MPTYLVKRIDLDRVYPPFLQRFLEVIAQCEREGAHYFAQLGTRTFQEQDLLFAKGRTAPGPKVTNARGGESLHCFGLACDVIRDADLNKVDLQPDWKSEGYIALHKAAALEGLETGLHWTFSDAGHIQLPRPKAFKTDGAWCRALSVIHAKGGLPAVWAHLDATYKFGG